VGSDIAPYRLSLSNRQCATSQRLITISPGIASMPQYSNGGGFDSVGKGIPLRWGFCVTVGSKGRDDRNRCIQRRSKRIFKIPLSNLPFSVGSTSAASTP